MFWSFFSAKELRVSLQPMRWGQFLILLAGMIILNFRALTIDIPWRGDEGIDITRTLALASKVSILWVLAFMIASV